MELRQIKYFLAIVDFGTFMAAAKHVYVSQPTLSSGIFKLEQSLDVKLFHRGSRLATLTTAGELFLNYARPAYNQLLSVRSKLLAEQDKIKIGILNSIPVDHIAEIISTYRAMNPHVLVEVVVARNDELSKMLKREKLDMVFTTSQSEPNLFTWLFNEKLMLVVPTQHPFSVIKEIDLMRLDEQPFIERTNCESWVDVHNEFQKQGIKPKRVCQAENDDSVLSLVAAGLGISIMPARNTPYGVKFLGIKELQIVRGIGIALSSKVLAKHVEAFCEFTLKKYGISS